MILRDLSSKVEKCCWPQMEEEPKRGGKRWRVGCLADVVDQEGDPEEADDRGPGSAEGCSTDDTFYCPIAQVRCQGHCSGFERSAYVVHDRKTELYLWRKQMGGYIVVGRHTLFMK